MVFDTAIMRCEICKEERSEPEIDQITKHGFDNDGEPKRVEFYRCASNTNCIRRGHELVKKLLPGGVIR